MLHSDPTSAITARLEELPFSDPRNNGLALRLRYARSVWRRVQWRWCNSPGSRFSALEGRLECAALDLPGQRHAFCRRRRVLEVPDAAQVRQLVIQARQPTSTRPPPASQTRTWTAAISGSSVAHDWFIRGIAEGFRKIVLEQNNPSCLSPEAEPTQKARHGASSSN